MKKSLAMMLALIMVCALPGIASAKGNGSIERAVITHEGGYLKDAVSIDLKDIKFEESVKVELFSDETLLTTATLKGSILSANTNHPFVTCCIPTVGEDNAWSLTPWIPRDKIVPNKAVLFVDGEMLHTKDFTLNAEEWAALPGTALPGSINGAGITQDAVFIELQDIIFEKSVQVKLFSGDTLLTTATLNEGKLNANTPYQFVTCCIPTVGADDAWSLTPWIPRDKIVPNKAVLVVDGHEEDWKEFTLDAKEWAALPGTAFPYSGSIERAAITHDNGVLKNAVSVDLKNVTFKTSVQVKLYRDETLLTTATLQGVNPGSHDFLTCCIATETADANWALTPWTPKDDVVPNRAVLVVDGHEENTKTFTLDADEWAALPGTALPGKIERAAITHDNGVLKNAVSVDLKNVTFKTSVQVKLYRDETLLTTATLQGVNPGSHDFLTCCIATETADANWALTPWTPKDDVVPNKVVLFVDGHEMDMKTFELDAKEWAALPGTVLPSSGSTTGGESHWHSPVTPAPVPVVVIPPKTGDMTIWQSILHFFGVI